MRDQNLTVILTSLVQIQLSGCRTIFRKITDLIGKKLHLGNTMFINQIPLIPQLVDRRTVM